MYYSDVNEICRYFLLSGLTPEQQQAKEEQYGYRGKCVKLLAKISSYSVHYVQKWGKGLAWNNMRPLVKAHLTIVYLRALLEDKDNKIQSLKRQLQEKEARLRRYETLHAVGVGKRAA